MAIRLTDFAAVLFDMDGLLLDSERIALDAFLAACRHFNLGDESELFKRCIGANRVLGQQILAEGFQGRIDPLTFEEVWDRRYRAATATQPIPLKPGAVALVDAIGDVGVPMAVVTSTRTASAESRLRDAGIRDRFQLLVGGDQVERSKPHPDIYLIAAQRLGVEPTRCLGLEDSENGVRAGVAAGLTMIQVPDLVAPSPDLIGLGHRILDSLDAVRAYCFPTAGEAEG